MNKKIVVLIIPLLLLGTVCKKNDSAGVHVRPELISPENGVVITENPPTLTWKKIQERYAYHIIWSTDVQFREVFPVYLSINYDAYSMSYTLREALAPGTYYWKVRWTECVDT